MVSFTPWRAKQADPIKETRDKVLDVAHSTYTNVQGAVTTGVDLAQGLLPGSDRRARKRARRAQKKVQKNLYNLQKGAQTTWGKTQGALHSSVDTAQDILTRNTKAAQQRVQMAQRNLQTAQHNVQKGISFGLTKTQNALDKGTRQVSNSVQQVASGAKGMGASVQDQYDRYIQRRKRARRLFRWGLAMGIVLALLYAPLAGSEVRQRIVAQWQTFRSYFDSYFRA